MIFLTPSKQKRFIVDFFEYVWYNGDTILEGGKIIHVP